VLIATIGRNPQGVVTKHRLRVRHAAITQGSRGRQPWAEGCNPGRLLKRNDLTPQLSSTPDQTSGSSSKNISLDRTRRTLEGTSVLCGDPRHEWGTKPHALVARAVNRGRSTRLSVSRSSYSQWARSPGYDESRAEHVGKRARANSPCSQIYQSLRHRKSLDRELSSRRIHTLQRDAEVQRQVRLHVVVGLITTCRGERLVGHLDQRSICIKEIAICRAA